MRSITVRSFARGVERWATNQDGYGVFFLENGAYRQLRRPTQTPHFTDPRTFRDYLRDTWDVLGKTVDTTGWGHPDGL